MDVGRDAVDRDKAPTFRVARLAGGASVWEGTWVGGSNGSLEIVAGLGRTDRLKLGAKMTDTIVAGLMGVAGALTGALIGGGMAMWGARQVAVRTSRELESAEIRRQKILCITTLSGLRWVLAADQAPPDFKAQFNSEFNKIPVLWSGNQKVFGDYRGFLDERIAERRDDRLIRLLSSLVESGLPIDKLGDADLKNVFWLK